MAACPQYMQSLLRWNPNTINDRLPWTNLFTKRQKTRVVNKLHLLLVYRDPHIIMTGINFCCVLRPLMVQFKKPFLHHYLHVLYITRIIHVWWHIQVTDFFTTVWEKNNSGRTGRTTCIWLWGIAMNRPELSQSIDAALYTVISSEWPIGICCDKHPGTTFEDVKQHPACIGNDGSWFEVNEHRTYIQDNCVAYRFSFYE